MPFSKYFEGIHVAESCALNASLKRRGWICAAAGLLACGLMTATTSFSAPQEAVKFDQHNWKSAPPKMWDQLNHHPIRVACVGDSITFGVGIQNRDENSYPAQLQKLLGCGFEVKNFGVSGATMLRNGDFSYWDRGAFTDAVQMDPDIIFIKLGTNDTKPQNWRYADQFENDYRDMIRYFKSLPTQPRVVILLPVPVFQARWGINEPALVDDMMPMLHRLVESEGVDFIDLYSALKPYPQHFPDFIHPNAAGAQVMAETVAKYFK